MNPPNGIDNGILKNDTVFISRVSQSSGNNTIGSESSLSSSQPYYPLTLPPISSFISSSEHANPPTTCCTRLDERELPISNTVNSSTINRVSRRLDTATAVSSLQLQWPINDVLNHSTEISVNPGTQYSYRQDICHNNSCHHQQYRNTSASHTYLAIDGNAYQTPAAGSSKHPCTDTYRPPAFVPTHLHHSTAPYHNYPNITRSYTRQSGENTNIATRNASGQLEDHNRGMRHHPYNPNPETSHRTNHQSYTPFAIIRPPVTNLLHYGYMDYSTGSPRYRQRLTQACTNCRRKKIKCDRTIPCRSCKVKGMECRLGEKKKRGPKPRHELMNHQVTQSNAIGSTACILETVYAAGTTYPQIRQSANRPGTDQGQPVPARSRYVGSFRDSGLNQYHGDIKGKDPDVGSHPVNFSRYYGGSDLHREHQNVLEVDCSSTSAQYNPAVSTLSLNGLIYSFYSTKADPEIYETVVV